MSRNGYDIVIVGGGMVGVSLGLLLGQHLPSRAKILLLESFPMPAEDAEYASTYSPSFDARSTALSRSSYQIYSELGVWQELRKRACPIESIHVSERGRFGSTLMQASEQGWDALGHVIENAWLGHALIQALYRQNRAQMQSPARVVSAQANDAGYELGLESGEAVQARLLIVADGADSGLRDLLGIDAARHRYGDCAVIGNIAHEQSHGGRAFERFTDQGPLAMLPLLDDESGQHRSALVWTLPPELAEARLADSESDFLDALQDRFGYRLGQLQQVGERSSYPLSLVQASEQVRQNLVVLGNAAHALHPVAGQGFNLALRDCDALVRVLAGEPAESWGELALLETYHEGQLGDQQRTVQFSDKLPGLFSHRDRALTGLRDLGLFALDLSPGLKREFVAHTAGVAALNRGRDRA